MIRRMTGTILLVTLLMTSLMTLLILAVLSSIQLEHKLFNRLDYQQGHWLAMKSVLNDIAGKLSKLSPNGRLSHDGLVFNYQIKFLNKHACLLIKHKDKWLGTRFYQVLLNQEGEMGHYAAHLAIEDFSIKACTQTPYIIPYGIQSLYPVLMR